MFRRFAVISMALAASAVLLYGDFSYEQTSQITGGAMASMMKMAGAFSKQAREPIRGTMAVKGDRMVQWNSTSASIMDIAAETITHIDFQKKTYSVMTFAEMQKALEELSQKMKSKDGNSAEMHFKVSVNPTGETKQMAGFNAREVILKMEMEATDAKSGQKAAGMTITTDMWIAPPAAGYEEIKNFHKRMAEKVNWAPGGNPFLQRPDIMKGMAEAAKEMAKIDGMPVYQVMKMGSAGMPEGSDSGAGTAAPPQQQQQAERPSLGGALGGALGGRLGGFGRKRKAEQPPAQDTAQAPASAPAAQGDASGALLVMTTEMSNFSSAPVDASKFEVPAGFKKVDSDLRRGR